MSAPITGVRHARERTTCPRCGRRTIYRRDGIFRWRACPASRACGWTVFTHGWDERDTADER
jgi:ribosomal protein L37AE/L43A